MKGKPIVTCAVCAALIVAGLVYAFFFFGEWANAQHIQGARGGCMATLKAQLVTYRDHNGRCPDTLKELVASGESDEVDICDLMWPHEPMLYYPNAKPGTSDILVAQPTPHRWGLWPFITVERWVIRANGKLDVVYGDKINVDSN